jgi:hypothetical protein
MQICDITESNMHDCVWIFNDVWIGIHQRAKRKHLLKGIVGQLSSLDGGEIPLAFLLSRRLTEANSSTNHRTASNVSKDVRSYHRW